MLADQAEDADARQRGASRPPRTLDSPPHDGVRTEAASRLSTGSPTTVPPATGVGGISRQRTVGTLGERLMIQHGLPTTAFTPAPSAASDSPISRGGQCMVPRGMLVGRFLQHHSALPMVSSGNEWPATLLTVLRPSGQRPGVMAGSLFRASLMDIWTCFIPSGRWRGPLSAEQRHGWDGTKAS
jgi:hypothetical protein